MTTPKPNLEDLLGHFSHELYPAQEEAILEIFEEHNVILNTPTGSGKSLVALSFHYYSFYKGRRSFYTCPIKALVNEKFLQLCKFFGPDNVGLMTGDATVNSKAPIICCTAEILANISLREGERSNVHDVVMDEFHYYSDRDRGWAWQAPLLTLKHCRFLLMSATMGDSDFFINYLQEFTGVKTALVTSTVRPVPLHFSYQDVPLEIVLENLIGAGKSPIYLVNFTQREAANVAQNLLSTNFCSKEEKQKISEAIHHHHENFKTPFGKEINKLLRHGIGLHHAGLLPRYRILTEKLAQLGLLKIICGTDTLGVGVNIPLKTVLFTKLCKFNGEKTTLLTNRDFHQIAGRAGRKGFDDIGFVVAMAPEHVITNKQIDEKAKTNPKKKNTVRARPPEKGFVNWDQLTFERMTTSAPEALKSSFRVTQSMLLSVLSRDAEDGCRAMRDIIKRSHENERIKKQIKARTFQYFRAFVQRHIIELPSLKIHMSLQDEFSLNQPLSLYLMDTIKLIPPTRESYALDVLTLVEAICEDPDVILSRQLDKVKREKIEEWKAQGMEYEERMEKLEELEYPKPLREFVYSTFNEFRALHPWVDEQENISPKSIVREMFETYSSFNDYIKEYALERNEGTLLRYCSEVYKVIAQTVPVEFKNDEVLEMETYLTTIIREIDSALIDEWERLKNPQKFLEKREDKNKEKDSEEVFDPRQFSILVRNKIFRLVRHLAFHQYEEFLYALDDRGDFDLAKIQELMDVYYNDESHEEIVVGPSARAKSTTRFHRDEVKKVWTVEQVLVDTDSSNDWCLRFLVDLGKSEENKSPHLQLIFIGESLIV